MITSTDNAGLPGAYQALVPALGYTAGRSGVRYNYSLRTAIPRNKVVTAMLPTGVSGA